MHCAQQWPPRMSTHACHPVHVNPCTSTHQVGTGQHASTGLVEVGANAQTHTRALTYTQQKHTHTLPNTHTHTKQTHMHTKCTANTHIPNIHTPQKYTPNIHTHTPKTHTYTRAHEPTAAPTPNHVLWHVAEHRWASAYSLHPVRTLCVRCTPCARKRIWMRVGWIHQLLRGCTEQSHERMRGPALGPLQALAGTMPLQAPCTMHLQAPCPCRHHAPCPCRHHALAGTMHHALAGTMHLQAPCTMPLQAPCTCRPLQALAGTMQAPCTANSGPTSPSCIESSMGPGRHHEQAHLGFHVLLAMDLVWVQAPLNQVLELLVLHLLLLLLQLPVQRRLLRDLHMCWSCRRAAVWPWHVIGPCQQRTSKAINQPPAKEEAVCLGASFTGLIAMDRP